MRRFSWWGWKHSWGLLVCIGSVLRAWQLGSPALWYDETNTAWMAMVPFGRMLLATGGDVHPPLYLAVMWVWVRLVGGVNPWTFRIPSLAFSILGLFAARRLMDQLGLSPRAILISTALLALLPFQIYYAQEARMYALVELLFIVACTAALERRWAWLAVWNAALIWTHNYGAFYALTSSLLGLAVVLRDIRFMQGRCWRFCLRQDLTSLIGFNLLALASYLPWIRMLAGQMAAVKDGWWQTPTTAGAFFSAWHMLFWQYALPAPLDLLGALIVFCLMGLAIYTGLRVYMMKPWEDPSWTAAVLLGLTAAVPALALGVEVVYRPIWLWRSLIGVSVTLYLLIGWALDRLPRLERAMALGALAPLLAASLVWYYPFTDSTKGDRYEVIQTIADQYQPGDVLLHMDASTYSGFYFTFPIRSAPQYLYPPQPGTLGSLSQQTLDALQVPIADLDQVAWRRAWIIWGAGPTISVLEDRAVAGILAHYPYRTIYRMPASLTQTGGVWLIGQDEHGNR